jgi:hypothetical protein
MVLLWTVTAAWPCGGMFHAEGSLVESPAQEVILRQGDGWSEVDYRVEYEGDAADFGWVIPIPAPFVSLQDADGALFDTYRACTQPTLVVQETEPGCSCVGGASKGNDAGGGDTRSGGVDVVAEGFTGTYEYVVLEATSAKGLLDWLDEHGWSTMGAGEAIDAYVADGGFQFVAISLAPTSAETPSEGRELPPVRIRYDGNELVYPARMARVLMHMEEVRTRVFVEGDQRATVSGWDGVELSDLSATDADDAAVVFDERLRDVGGDDAQFAIVAAMVCTDEEYVTRFESLTEPSAHAVDATFALDGGMEGLQTTISVASAEGVDTGWLFVPLLGLAWKRRRR